MYRDTSTQLINQAKLMKEFKPLDMNEIRPVDKIRYEVPSSLEVQVGGNHYKEYRIQPVEYIYKNNISYFEGNVIKYITRWKDKGGRADLEKAKHYIDLLIELEFGNGDAT